jgi:hypothetical protein
LTDLHTNFFNTPNPILSLHFEMSLGTLCVVSDTGRRRLDPDAVTIEAVQQGFVVSLKITQRFTNSTPNPVDAAYVIPNNSKICLYGTTFRLRDEVITPKLERLSAAKELFEEGKSKGRAAILALSLGDGLIDFQLGNLPPKSSCEVEVECGLVASVSGPQELSFKFPLVTCTPSGSRELLSRTLRGTFVFRLRNLSPADVREISSNVFGTFDPDSCTYESRRYHIDSMLLTTTMNRPIASAAICAGRHLCGTVILDKLESGDRGYNEFVFVIDCSGSMHDKRIKQARECLAIFIQSLPEGSFFNVVRFGSQFEVLFPESVAYSQSTAAKALQLAAEMPANLGGTEILAPLEWIFNQPLKGTGMRQVFLITDGEVHNTSEVIGKARANRNLNRCFTIGIGGADAGLIEGIADATAARAEFVGFADDLSMKVIPDLELSIEPAIANVGIHVESHEQAEICPYPLSIITPNVGFRFYVRSDSEIQPGAGVLITGTCLDEGVEAPMKTESGEAMARCISALFAFESIGSLEAAIDFGSGDVEQLKQRCVLESLESGILCRETAFVGFSNRECVRGPQQIPLCATGCYFPPPDPPFSLKDVVSLQSINGSWQEVEPLFELMETRVPEFAALSSHAEARAVFATIVGLAILRVIFPKKAAAWRMVEAKALKWLTHRGVDNETLIAEAARWIPT